MHPNFASNLTAQQIDNMMRQLPCVKLDTGEIRTCPVRLSFPYFFDKQQPMEPGQSPKWACTALFFYGADLSVLYAESQATALAKWPNAFQPGGPTLANPFRDQGEKSHFEGYVPGAIFITSSSERRQPPVVHVTNPALPIIDKSKVYPGVWALLTVRPFAYDKKVKRGISWGLQSAMILADDKELGGGSSDPTKQYAGVQPIEGLSIAPAALLQGGHGFNPPPQAGNFGAPPQQGYGAPPQQGYGAPPQQGYGAPPQQPAYQDPALNQQQGGYGQPPMQPGFTGGGMAPQGYSTNGAPAAAPTPQYPQQPPAANGAYPSNPPAAPGGWGNR